MKKRIIFFGNERLATATTTTTPTMNALVSAGYDIAAVIANQHRGTSRKSRPLEIESAANEHGIPIFTPASADQTAAHIKKLQPVIGILVAYGRIVPQSIIDLFPHGIINIHPSLLPQHRGPIPIEQVILDDAPKTGVSIMQLTREMDAGPVFAQAEHRLTGRETKDELAGQLLRMGKDLLIEHLPAILDGTLKPTPQDDRLATYDKPIRKADGTIDWRLPAAQIERQVRAYLGWPGSRTTLCGSEVTITEVHLPATPIEAASTSVGSAIKTPTGELAVSTGGGIVLVDRLKPSGKAEMTGKAFLAGRKI